MEKERDTNTTVVFIFLKDHQVLLERRPTTSSFAGMDIYPGGSVKDNELDELESALKREIIEELGVTPIDIFAIPCQQDIYGETGRLLRPYLIPNWEGNITEVILDKGNPIFWEDLEVVANHQLESVRKLTLALKSFLANK